MLKRVSSALPIAESDASRFADLVHGTYDLPGNPEKDIYIIPCSGGADSTALAILMHVLYPFINFVLMFTDTLAEEPELYVTLDNLEEYLGKKIARIVPEKGLYDLIDHYKGYLPSSQSRWCTRELKLEPFEKFISEIRVADEQIYTFVGIRADETQRIGLMSQEDHIHTELPYRALGVGREQVFKILERTVGVPRLYQHRTRSGCSCCPFQRRSELIGLLQTEPTEFDKGMRYEKVSESDLARHHDNALPAWRDTGISTNHQSFPVPQRVDARTSASSYPVKWGKKKSNGNVIPMFDEVSMSSLWVGVEFFIDPNVGDHGVWHQNLVCYSSTRGGLQRQLQGHYQHRVQTPEVYGMDVFEMKDQLKLAVYHIQVPSSLMDIKGPTKGESYTWSSGESYAQIKHLVGWAKRSLHIAGLKQSLVEYANAKPGSWKHEQYTGRMQAFENISEPYGELIAMDMFVPEDKIKDVEDEKLVACFHCSI